MLPLDKVQKDKISPWTLKRCLKWNLKSEEWTYHSDSIASPWRILSRWNPEPSPASNARFMGEGSSFWISPPDATKRWMASLIWCRSGVGSTDNFCFISPKIIVQFLLDVNHEMLIPACVHQHGKNKKSIYFFRSPVLPPFFEWMNRSTWTAFPGKENQFRSWDWVLFKPGNANKAFPKQSRKFSREIKKATVNQDSRRCLDFLWHGASMVPIEKRLFLNE